MAIQDNISDDYLSQYNLSLGVSATQKLTSFAFIQKLTYNGILEQLKENFLGLQDWVNQITLYSAANPVQLTSSFNTIKNIINLNTEIASHIIYDTNLGFVGELYNNVQGAGKVFNLSGNELTNPTVIDKKASNFT